MVLASFPAFSLASRLPSLPSTAQDRKLLVSALWVPAVADQEYALKIASYDAYLQHIYTDLCRVSCTGQNRLSAFTHEGLLEACHLLQAPAATLTTVLNSLGHHSPKYERLVRVAASLLTSLNIQGGAEVRPGRSIPWTANQPLSELANSYISPAPAPQHVGCLACNQAIPLPTSLTAYNLEFVAGFEIVWTSVISDHLKILEVDDKFQVYIFHLTVLLERSLTSTTPLIPHDLANETLETLALLLPKRNDKVQKWFQKLQRKHGLDPKAAKCAHFPSEYRNIAHFLHWGLRLRDLKELWDGRELPSPKYFWRDRSKPLQWWTFWIAVWILGLTVVFGLIQSITGVLQVTKSE